MKLSDDVRKLYEGFGGDAGSYQEFGRMRAAEEAIKKWPLFTALVAQSVAGQSGLSVQSLTTMDESIVFDAKHVYVQWYRSE